MTAHDPTRGLDTLADTLWTERHVVGFLLFKLVTAKLLLAADERRFVAHALDEVERVIEVLRDAELRRTVAVEAFARDRGLPAADITLGWLAANAPAPWREVFADHRDGFTSLAAEIEETSTDNRQLAKAGLNKIRQSIDMLTASQPRLAPSTRGDEPTPPFSGPFESTRHCSHGELRRPQPRLVVPFGRRSPRDRGDRHRNQPSA